MNDILDLLKTYMSSFIGTPYKWGGDDPIDGFDCSGFVQEILASVEMDPPGDQTAQQLYDHFKTRSSGRVLGLGALCFYGPSLTQINHVAIMIDSVSIIEAGGGGAKTITRKDAADQNAFIRARRFDRRKDLVAVLMPLYGRMK